MADRLNGMFLVRIEDIDRTRSREAHVAAIMADLIFIGAPPDAAPVRQSLRMALYGEALERLAAMGLIYPSFETRADLARQAAAIEARTGCPAPRDPDGALLVGRSDGANRGMTGEPVALRLDMAAALKKVTGPLIWSACDEAGQVVATHVADPARWGDVVLARKETPTSYHLSVVVDDAAQGISHVVRGQDLEAATDLHCLLQHLLGLPVPVYHHHRLLVGPDGRKLSKSEGATSLQALRAGGATRSDVLRLLGLA